MHNSAVEVGLKKFPHHEGLPVPGYQSIGASGMDLYAAVDENVVIHPGKRELIPTGIAISLPPGYEAQIRPRSGLAIKHGIGLLNSPGTVDSDYRGEIKIIMMNLGEDSFVVSRGMRIAQMIVSKFIAIDFKIVDELDVTLRNEGGFGHTGLN